MQPSLFPEMNPQPAPRLKWNQERHWGPWNLAPCCGAEPTVHLVNFGYYRLMQWKCKSCGWAETFTNGFYLPLGVTAQEFKQRTGKSWRFWQLSDGIELEWWPPHVAKLDEHMGVW
jgi:hypothetical protein